MNLVKKIKNQKGTSLLELLVAMSLFVVMILAATQIFKMVIDGQRNSVSAQNVQESIRYAMEKISKEIRMAEKSDNSCLNVAGNRVFNVVTTGGNDRIYFENKEGNCLSYYLGSGSDSGRLIVEYVSSGATEYVTPVKVEVSNLKFYVVDDPIGAFHSVQPYVTIKMDVRAVGPAIHEQRMKIQMTVSSRYYE